MHILEQGWRESQRLEAAEHAARRQESPHAQPQPKAKAASSSSPAVPLPQERAATDARQLLLMRDQDERAAAIRDSMLDTDVHYADAFQEQLIELGIGAHGELFSGAQRRASQSQSSQSEPQDARSEAKNQDWPRQGNNGPER